MQLLFKGSGCMHEIIYSAEYQQAGQQLTFRQYVTVLSLSIQISRVTVVYYSSKARGFPRSNCDDLGYGDLKCGKKNIYYFKQAIMKSQQYEIGKNPQFSDFQLCLPVTLQLLVIHGLVVHILKWFYIIKILGGLILQQERVGRT